MRKSILFPLLLLLFVIQSSFVLHKFYVSIYEMNYVPEKKMLQITARIFVDDINSVLQKKYNRTTFIGEKNEATEDVVLLKKYLAENFIIKVNKQPVGINFQNKEMEGNVLICYLTCKDISKIKTLEVKNTALFELDSEQQNIIQTTIYGKKESLLLVGDQPSGVIK